MEDILASIRDMLNEDEQQAVTAGPLELSEAMLVPAPEAPAPDRASRLREAGAVALGGPLDPEAPPSLEHPAPVETHAENVMTLDEAQAGPAAAQADLLGPVAAAATAAALGELARAVAADRRAPVLRPAGPSIEDVVREEMRPLLKAWLDANLPSMVERLVRAEIERVMGRPGA